MVARTTESVGC